MRRACSIRIVNVRFRNLFETNSGAKSLRTRKPHMASDAGAFTVLTSFSQELGAK
jgi:hypothetical protein